MATAALSTLSPDFFAAARANMVESQLRPNRVLDDRILRAMARLPREEFVALNAQSFAYSDEEVSIGYNRKLLSPMVFARLAQEAQVGSADRVLIIGAGTGYGAAVLNEMAGEVVAMETDPALLRLLQQNCQKFELENVRAVQGSLIDGYTAAAPYQVIFIEGGVQWLPENLLMQLTEGGRLMCVYYGVRQFEGQLGRAHRYDKNNGRVEMQDLFDAAAPLLPAFASRPRFEF
ncbi:MAG TPA: protein-L-isoaspartate O-methyltransferase [Alphaproteobacteria bacterium]|nr:protein-L-isoaspartate O-methyltransferase [Alphaproteobacteria bacterium]